jgi:hypothetical protein
MGDDFAFEPTASVSELNCAGNTCASSDYAVVADKVTQGVNYAACTGAQIMPSEGALTKGQLYYVRVLAYNAIGYSLPQLALNPQKPMVVPGIPTGVSLTVNSGTSLKVIFSPPDDNGGDTITYYVVSWSVHADFRTSESTQVTMLSGGAPFFCILSGLVKGTFYFVNVAAHNSQGTGLAAVSSPPSLNPHTIPSAPTNVVVGVTSPSMVTVGWQVPADDGGGSLSGYIVEWDLLASYNSLAIAPDRSKVTIADITQRSYTISLLTPATAYYVRVYAVNSLGPGTPQDAFPLPCVPDMQPPGKPVTLSATAVTTPTPAIYVQWQAPYIPAHGIPCFGNLASPSPCPLLGGDSAVYGGAMLASYTVEWSTSTVFDGTTSKSTLGMNLNLLPGDGIVSGTTYYIRVQAVNGHGLKSSFCQRANAGPYLCPDNLLLPDGSFATGAYVSVTAP